MRNLARRAGRLAIVPVLTGMAVLGAAAPAIAATPLPQPDELKCSEEVDGVRVCLVTTRKPDGSASVRASVAIEEGRTLRGALVVLEACDGERCTAQEVATGQDTGEVTTKGQDWGRGVGYYRANASWVDDERGTHTGVVHPAY